MPKARSKPQPVNLHARRAKALAGNNEITLNPRVPGPYSNTSIRPGQHALVLQGLSEEEAALCRAACNAILRVRRDPKVFAKHGANDYQGESAVSHLLAASGHALIGARIDARFKPVDGEYHPDKALCRVACALANAERREFNRLLLPVPPQPLGC